MLTIDNARVTFNQGTPSEVVALNDVTLHVNDGDFVTVIGANGAGKSTLFNIVAGSIIPNRGRIVLGEQDITHWREHRRSNNIGRVFQIPAREPAPVSPSTRTFRWPICAASGARSAPPSSQMTAPASRTYSPRSIWA